MMMGKQMQQAIASVQNASATMKTFAQQTQDQKKKDSFEQLAKTLDSALDILQGNDPFIEQQDNLDDLDDLVYGMEN